MDRERQVQMLAQVLDDDHFAMDLLVQWSIDGEVICEWAAPDGGGNATCAVTPSVNMNQIRAEVKDPEWFASSARGLRHVESTNPPDVEILTLWTVVRFMQSN